MTPVELHAAVAPLWARDAGFIPTTRILPTGAYELAALIRDRIVERLGERGNSVCTNRSVDGTCFVTLEGSDVVDDGGFDTPCIVVSNHDRTLALIAAALAATAPAASAPRVL